MSLQRIATGNWAYCLSQLGNRRLASAREGMKDRIERGTDDKEHFNSGAWFSENFNVVGGRIFGARAEFNPLIKYAEKAVEAHRAGREFYLTDEIVDATGRPYSQLLHKIARADSKKPIGKKRVIDLAYAKTHGVPTDSFAYDKTILFLAQGEKLARQYGNFLKNNLGFEKVTVYLPEIKEEDYARGFWFYGLGSGGSSFGCYDRDLNNDGGGGSVFGVLEICKMGKHIPIKK